MLLLNLYYVYRKVSFGIFGVLGILLDLVNS